MRVSVGFLKYFISIVICLLCELQVLRADVPRKPTVEISQVLKLSDRARARLPQQVKRAAILKYGIESVALRRSFVARHNTHYGVAANFGPQHKVRDQKNSGRCYIFATDCVLESKLQSRGITAPPLSSSFINYHAIRHQAFAQLAWASNTDKPIHLGMDTGVGEGGFQAWALTLIRQHGFVPESVMKSSYDANNSDLFTNQLQMVLLEGMRTLRRIKRSPETRTFRMRMVRAYQARVDELLNTALGKPPETFKVDGVEYTPKTFARDYLGLKSKDLDYVVLTNNCLLTWNRRYKVNYFNGMKPFEHYNVSMQTIKDAVQKTLEHGEAVYFASNVNPSNPYRAGRKNDPPEAKGILSISAFNYKDYIPEVKLSKTLRMKAAVNRSNHAMAFVACDPGPKQGSVIKWKVENSWGPKFGDHGYFHMYDDFASMYVEKVSVPRWAVNPECLAKIESKPPIEEDRKKVLRSGLDL